MPISEVYSWQQPCHRTASHWYFLSSTVSFERQSASFLIPAGIVSKSVLSTLLHWCAEQCQRAKCIMSAASVQVVLNPVLEPAVDGPRSLSDKSCKMFSFSSCGWNLASSAASRCEVWDMLCLSVESGPRVLDKWGADSRLRCRAAFQKANLPHCKPGRCDANCLAFCRL